MVSLVLFTSAFLPCYASKRNISVFIAHAQEIFFSSCYMLDRYTLPPGQFFKPPAVLDNFLIPYNAVNIKLKKFLDMVAVDKIGIPFDVLLPYNMALA